jgi:hypothetical protein
MNNRFETIMYLWRIGFLPAVLQFDGASAQVTLLRLPPVDP